MWLILAVATTSVYYLTSEELWSFYLEKNGYILNPLFFGGYCLIFFLVNVLIRYYVLEKQIKNKLSKCISSLFSFIFDTFLICLGGFVALGSINLININEIRAIQSLLLIGLPISLGASTGASISMEHLKKEIAKIEEKINENKLLLKELDTIMKDLEAESELRKDTRKKLLKSEENVTE